MANLSTQYFGLVLIFAIGATLISSGFASESVISPAPAENDPYVPLEKCAAKLTPACGDEIFAGVFGNGKVTEHCCYKLVEMGKPCHDRLVEWMLSIPDFREDAPKILSNSAKIWYHCIRVVTGVAPSPAF